jgi:hypothetical protein
LKEISKRTTFIRVTAQLNEIFSSNPNPQQLPAKSPLLGSAPSDRLAAESPHSKRAKAE